MENNRGFTQPFLKYVKLVSGRAGFTLVELIVATVILAIAVAGVYSAFVSAVKFIGYFRHDIYSTYAVGGLLQQVRSSYKYGNVSGLNTAPVNFSNRPLDYVLREDVDGSSVGAAPYTVTTESYGTALYPFKRIDVTVYWHERNI